MKTEKLINRIKKAVKRGDEVTCEHILSLEKRHVRKNRENGVFGFYDLSENYKAPLHEIGYYCQFRFNGWKYKTYKQTVDNPGCGLSFTIKSPTFYVDPAHDPAHPTESFAILIARDKEKFNEVSNYLYELGFDFETSSANEDDNCVWIIYDAPMKKVGYISKNISDLLDSKGQRAGTFSSCYGIWKINADNVAEKLRLVSRTEDKWKPAEDEGYYFPSAHNKDMFGFSCWDNCSTDKFRMKHGLVFKTKEEAVDMSKKMLKVVKGGNDED